MPKKIDKLIELVNQLEVQIYEPLYNAQYFNSGHWDYVVYNHKKFMNKIQRSWQLLGKKKGLKFIDVGCGIGSKVLLASMFFDSYGIELNKNYAKVAKSLNSPKKFNTFGRYKKIKTTDNIINGDAFQQDYSDYDLIYFFRPLNKQKLQIKLETKIMEEMKVNSILIPIYSQSKFPGYMKKVGQNIFMKIET